jgi:hypothetical protein
VAEVDDDVVVNDVVVDDVLYQLLLVIDMSSSVADREVSPFFYSKLLAKRWFL